MGKGRNCQAAASSTILERRKATTAPAALAPKVNGAPRALTIPTIKSSRLNIFMLIHSFENER
jgi:hypothetical protein